MAWWQPFSRAWETDISTRWKYTVTQGGVHILHSIYFLQNDINSSKHIWQSFINLLSYSVHVFMARWVGTFALLCSRGWFSPRAWKQHCLILPQICLSCVGALGHTNVCVCVCVCVCVLLPSAHEWPCRNLIRHKRVCPEHFLISDMRGCDFKISTINIIKPSWHENHKLKLSMCVCVCEYVCVCVCVCVCIQCFWPPEICRPRPSWFHLPDKWNKCSSGSY